MYHILSDGYFSTGQQNKLLVNYIDFKSSLLFEVCVADVVQKKNGSLTTKPLRLGNTTLQTQDNFEK